MLNDLNKLFLTIDQAFEVVRRAHPEAIACGNGCADCCQAVFDVSLVEAVNLQTHIKRLDSTVQDEIAVAAQEAQQIWEQMMAEGLNPALARIKCPLLDGQGLCLCYEARPVNCRTYGIPTEIEGKGHVCGFSGFEPGTSYPTVNLASLQAILHNCSVQLAGEENAARRWPIAAVVLDFQVKG